MRQPFAPRNTLRSSLRTSQNWLALPLLLVTACGGSAIADSSWGRLGFPDKLLPAPEWYIEWATEQAKLQPEPKQMAVIRAARLIWEARSGRSVDTLMADYDEATFAQAGHMSIDAIGYDEIMRRAEKEGWVEWVPVEQAQSAAAKRFIGDVPPSTKAIEEAFKLVMTKAAPAALSSARVPVIGDKLAVGILAVALVAAGGIVVYEIVTAQDTSVATTSAPAPASAVKPNATTKAPAVVAPRRHPGQTCEDKRLDELEAAKDAVCPQRPLTFPGESCRPTRENAKSLPLYPCSLIKARIAAVLVCVAARQKVQDECFKNSPDTGHPQQIDDLTKGITWCEALKAVNCAPGHPMSGL